MYRLQILGPVDRIKRNYVELIERIVPYFWIYSFRTRSHPSRHILYWSVRPIDLSENMLTVSSVDPPPPKGCSGCGTKRHLMTRLQFWRYWECSISHCSLDRVLVRVSSIGRFLSCLKATITSKSEKSYNFSSIIKLCKTNSLKFQKIFWAEIKVTIFVITKKKSVAFTLVIWTIVIIYLSLTFIYLLVHTKT